MKNTATTQIDLWVVFVWPVVVFLVGTIILTASKVAWRPIAAWLKQRRADRIITRRLADDTMDQADDVTVGQVISYQKRHPGTKFPMGAFSSVPFKPPRGRTDR